MAQLEFQQSTDNAKLEYQQSSDDVKLSTEGAMNQHHRAINDNTIKMKSTFGQIDRAVMRDKYDIAETDRQHQIQFNTASDRQKLSTLQRQGQIQNYRYNLSEKFEIENTGAREQNAITQDNWNSELQHTRSMGHQRIEIEAGMGQVKTMNERKVGQQRIQNEAGMGQIKTMNERAISNVKISTQQELDQLNRAKLIDGVRAQQAGAMINNPRHTSDLRFQHQKRLGS
jgi:replicative superfamily II helicase